jgi:hypothetical protein
VKIGFLIESDFVLKHYYKELSKYADCWWGVTDKNVLKNLSSQKYICHDCKSSLRDFKLLLYPYLDKFFKSRKNSKSFKLINTINDNGIFKKIFLSSYRRNINKIKTKIKPNIWISDSYGCLDYTSKDAYWIQTLHAVTIRKYVVDPLMLKYDLILLPGYFHKKLLINKFGKKIESKLRIIGWPRHDPLILHKYNRDIILTRLNLDPARKTILYAPSWAAGDRSDFFIRWFDKTEMVFEKLCKFCKEKKINFIVKLHSSSWNMINNKRIFEIAKQYNTLIMPKRKNHITEDPNPYLFVSDVLISDVSGIIHEYLVLDKPIIYIEPDEQTDPWLDIEVPKEYRPGYLIKESEELFDAIECSLNNPSKFSNFRKEVFNEIFAYSDGKSSYRGAREILNFAKEKGLEYSK